MRLEPSLRSYLAEIDRRLGPSPSAPDLLQRQLRAEQVAAAMMTKPPRIATQDWFIPLPGREVPIRIYRHAPSTRRPLVVFFHGGGWVTGSLDSHHYLAGALAEGADCNLVSVHYRRPPENPFPAPLDDCFEALR